MKKRSIVMIAALAAVLAGCSSGHQTFTPSTGGFSPLKTRSTAKETVLHGFTGSAKDGAAPISRLTKVGKLLYGVSGSGGASHRGTVFSISPTGAQFNVLYSFKGRDGSPSATAGLTNMGGTLYGVTRNGGAAGNGTVFKITPAGAFQTIYSFKGGKSDGATPTGGLTVFRKKLYGTTASGGNVRAGACSNCGTAFSISADGQERVIYFFGSQPNDGIQPISTMVVLGGKLYGTTSNGGIGGVLGDGTLFSMTTTGKETVLHSFSYKTDGSCGVTCGLTVLGGMLYGTAQSGGTNGLGSVFSLSPAGAFKTLYSASAKGNVGGNPASPLTVVNGTLYGTMSQGPLTTLNGTVFSVTTSGMVTVLYAFAGGNDASMPGSSLTLSGARLYAASQKGGGPKNSGAIYALSGF